jgi:alpha-tubulin suppressor-like RCC1 family protein
VAGIAAGDNHSLALLRDGTVLAWGSGFGLNLGQGTLDDDLGYPAAVKTASATLRLNVAAYPNLWRRGR